jgi:hypothetical protein
MMMTACTKLELKVYNCVIVIGLLLLPEIVCGEFYNCQDRGVVRNTL